MSLHPGVSQFPKKHREEPYKLVEGHFMWLILFDLFHSWFDKLTTNGINQRFPKYRQTAPHISILIRRDFCVRKDVVAKHQNPSPQRYCQAAPMASKSVPVRMERPVLA